MPQGWCVRVSVFNDLVLSISERELCGRDLSADDEDLIRGCAEHLLSFVGQKQPALPALPAPFDAQAQDATALRGACPICGSAICSGDHRPAPQRAKAQKCVGHDWLYRRVNANRRYCSRCGQCEYLSHRATRNGAMRDFWLYEDPTLKRQHDERDAAAAPSTED
jgi:hypothetical protein